VLDAEGDGLVGRLAGAGGLGDGGGGGEGSHGGALGAADALALVRSGFGEGRAGGGALGGGGVLGEVVGLHVGEGRGRGVHGLGSQNGDFSRGISASLRLEDLNQGIGSKQQLQRSLKAKTKRDQVDYSEELKDEVSESEAKGEEHVTSDNKCAVKLNPCVYFLRLPISCLICDRHQGAQKAS